MKTQIDENDGEDESKRRELFVVEIESEEEWMLWRRMEKVSRRVTAKVEGKELAEVREILK